MPSCLRSKPRCEGSSKHSVRNKHLLGELAAQGKMILNISHVLEPVEKVCAQVVIMYKGDSSRSCEADKPFWERRVSLRPSSRTF
jgi:ABC-type uncharacterized transport system ATPase subunit